MASLPVEGLVILQCFHAFVQLYNLVLAAKVFWLFEPDSVDTQRRLGLLISSNKKKYETYSFDWSIKILCLVLGRVYENLFWNNDVYCSGLWDLSETFFCKVEPFSLVLSVLNLTKKTPDRWDDLYVRTSELIKELKKKYVIKTLGWEIMINI